MKLDVVDGDIFKAGKGSEGIILLRDFYIKFSGDINDENVDKFSTLLDNQVRGQLFHKAKTGIEIPITISITSKGGYILDGFRLINSLLELDKRGIKYCVLAKGYVLSMALVVYLSSKNRKADPGTIFGLTEVDNHIYGDVSKESEEISSYHSDLQMMLVKHLVSVTSLTTEAVQELIYSKKIFNDESDILKYFHGATA